MAANPTKALADLETWKQKYPNSDFKDDREVYYIAARPAPNSRPKPWIRRPDC